MAENTTRERFFDLIARAADEVGEPAFDLGHALIDHGLLEAPASTKHHLAYAGGLAEHSVNVACALMTLVRTRSGLGVPDVACIVIGLCHDLCKCDSYRQESDDTWAWVPHTNPNWGDADPKGGWEHGALSARRTEELLRVTDLDTALGPELTRRVLNAISYHMGLYDHSVLGCHDAFGLDNLIAYRSAFLEACDDDPLVTLTHIADMVATHVMER